MVIFYSDPNLVSEEIYEYGRTKHFVFDKV